MSLVKQTLLSICLILVAIAFPRDLWAAQYFGYYGSDYGNDTNNYQAEFAANANLSWSTRGGYLPYITGDLQTASSLNLKVVVDVSALFFSGTSLRSDYQTQWNGLVAAIANTGTIGSVAAFYPQDEPNNSFSVSDLQTVVSTIKASYPNIPVAVIYAYDVNSNYRAPYLFDWVGIDCYSDGNWACQTKTYSQAYALLRAQLSSSQRMMLVPQSSTHDSSGGCCVPALIQEAKRYYDFSVADSKIVGIFPFTWQSIPGDTYTGVKDVAALQPIYQSIGSGIKNNWTYPSGIIPVFRNFNNTGGDWLFSTNGVEGINANFDFEQIGFPVYNSQIAGTSPLYRCYVSNYTHMLSTQSNCEGQTTEATLGYVYLSQASNTVPIYRFRNSGNGSHLTTKSYSEGVNAGLSYEGVLGYVPNVVTPSGN